ncbi:serine hydrolase domain-containing protein [Polaribacter porphyrae]|uniref:Beta-lactamase-related domain-containing protein n=1 Tax=Polaribacter porphyrae TaxID=1137780 RepID=A0A2S7WQL0_9FLAO|nr:serine hydrolase domain-containing protein [Polaribacter porphyrae]PQJ79908.1 hypothetical protein BTO18_12310 [Polaribacter porphyrae]
MKKIGFIIFLTFFSSQSILGQQTNSLNKIDDFLKEEYPKNEPGAVVLVAKKGEIIFNKAYGLASIKPKRKLKTNMVFQLASMSKQFVSAAILQLVEQGKMKLSDSIQKFVPYYPSKKHIITIHHLLSQTSGIPNYFDVDDNEFYLLAKEHTPKELINYYKDRPLLFKPGSKWAYSNSNYPLLGAALEKVTGLSLKEYLKTYIFEPLQMHSTGLWYTSNTKKKNIVTGYNSKRGILFPAPKMVGSALYAPGGIVATTKDLFLWNEALKRKTIISKYVVEQLITEKKTDDGKGTGYGYGFFSRNLQGSKTIQHGGNLFGFTTNGMYLPNEDIYVCILANTKFDRVNKISDYIASTLMNNPIEIFTKKEISAEKLREYIGIYELQGELERVFEIKLFDNRLVLSDPKNPEADAFLTPSEKDVFIFKAVSVAFKFFRNDKNEIIGYTVKQGENYTFKKVK